MYKIVLRPMATTNQAALKGIRERRSRTRDQVVIMANRVGVMAVVQAEGEVENGRKATTQ